MHLSLHWVQPNILTKMGAIAPVSAINRMVNIILSTGIIGAEVCIFAPVSAMLGNND